MNTKEYWNKVADEKTFSTPFQMDIFKKYVDKDKQVLDIGCGYGRILKELYDNGYTNLIGIDFSKEMINKAISLYPFITFNITSGDKLDYPDNSVDAVIILAVLTCIPSTKDQEAFINEIHRILKKDGIIYINDYLLNTTDMYLERYNKYKDEYKEYGIFATSDGGVFRHHSKDYLDNLLKDFTCLEEKELQYITMNGHTANGIYYIGRK